MRRGTDEERRVNARAALGGERETPHLRNPQLSRARGQALRAVEIVLTGGLLGFLLWRTSPGELGRAVAGSDARLALAVTALNIPVAILYAFRTHMLLARLGYRMSPHLLFPVAILGNVAGSLTPAAGGESVRVALLRSHAGVSARDGLAVVLYERGLSISLLALGTSVAAACLFLPLGWALAIALLAVPALAVPNVMVHALRYLRAPSHYEKEGMVRSGVRRLHAVAGQLRYLLEDPWLQARWSLVTGAIFGLTTLQLWLLASSMSRAISPVGAWFAFGASQLIAIASLLPLGLGVADGSLAGILRRLGMGLEQGLAMAILVRATMTLPLLAMAAASYLYLIRKSPRPAD